MKQGVRRRRVPGLVPFVTAVFLGLTGFSAGMLDDILLMRSPVAMVPFPDEQDVESEVPVMKASLETPASRTQRSGSFFSLYRVESGDTVSKIAYRYSLSPATILSLNKIERSRELEPGARILIPYCDGRRVEFPAGENRSTAAARLGVAASDLLVIPGEGGYFIPGVSDDPVPENRRKVEFAYPVSGPVLTAFGPETDELTGIPYNSDGVDWQVSTGTPVGAAKSGRVAATGNHPRYGLYVMLVHPGGWKSFYANLGRVSVAYGDALDQGDILGLSGASGSARSPRLYFSLLKDGTAVDPLDYLR